MIIQKNIIIPFVLLLLLSFTACSSSRDVVCSTDNNIQSFIKIKEIVESTSPFVGEEQMKYIEETYQKVIESYTAQMDSSSYDVYVLFEQLAAALKEGHSGVFASQELLSTLGQLPVKVKYLNGSYYISDAITTNTQLLYKEITAINQIPTEEYLDQNIYPLISTTTPNAKQQKAADRLVIAPNGESITFKLKDSSGNSNNYKFTYSTANNTANFVGMSSMLSEILSQTDVLYSSPNFVYTHIQNNPYLAIFSFQDGNLYTEFAENIFPLLQNETQLILDIRTNNGGNGKTAKDILFLLTGQESVYYPFTESKIDLSEIQSIFEETSLQVAQQHNLTPLHLSQIVILTSHTSYSAADDFVFYAKQSPIVTTIGTNTGGATGMVKFFQLPNDSTFCCSVIRDFDQSHNDITGNGIQPDIWVWQNIADVRNRNDTVLSTAIELIK